LKRADLLIVIAVWEILTAMPALITLALIGAFAYPPIIDLSGAGEVGGLVGLSIVEAVLLVYCCLSIVAAIGLIVRAEWGRIAAIVHAAASLIQIPFGTIIGVLVIVYLTRPRIKAYFRGQDAGELPA
jgi:uncharacterized membrane protein (DUF2068 family)